MNKVSKIFNTDYYVRIYLLGEFRITRMDGTDITPSSVKARCILAILALSETGKIARDEISQLLWSRHAQEQARTSLRQSLSLLRRTLLFENEHFFTTDRNNVYLKKDNVWIDLHEISNNSAEPLSNTLFNTQSLLNLRADALLGNLHIHDPNFDNWLTAHKNALKNTINTALEQTSSEKENTDNNILQQTAAISLQHITPVDNFTVNETTSSGRITPAEITITPGNTLSEQKISGDNELTREQSLYRNSLLNKVRDFWISGLLEQSLFNKITMELQLKASSEQILDSWKDIVQYKLSSTDTHGKPKESLRTNAEIGQIFIELSESMLILGAPGSGKTTLLLSLTQNLLKRAEQNTNHPIPVVFHLSTWARQRSPIEAWLEDELEYRYQMPRKASAKLIKNRGILPLLDGLDEVDTRYRADCVKAINHFRQNNTWLSMAICSREEDYKKLNTTITTAGTVFIQTITEAQCSTYLQAIAEPERGLNIVLSKNTQLKKLLTTPLMLNIASIAYHNHTRETLASEQSLNDAREHLFCSYIKTMLSRRPSTRCKSHYDNDSTYQWLSWLANTLNTEKQSIFYIDAMQPCRAARQAHYWLVTRGSVIICAFLTGITLGLLGGFVTDIKYSLSLSLIFSVFGGYVAGMLGYGDQIRPLMHIKLSWSIWRSVSIIKHLGNLLLAGSVALCVSLLYDPATGMALGFLWLILCVFFNALDFEHQCKQQIKHANPNEGMRKSLYNIAISSAMGGFLGFSTGYFFIGLQSAVIAGALASLISGLFFGGHTCIQHYLLRACLWRSRSAPLNYVRFLEYAVDRIFLYRVGGGYIFIHRSLAEYFAKNTSVN